MKTKSRLSNAPGLAGASCLLLAACSPPAHWVAVAGGEAREIAVFTADLSPDRKTTLQAPDWVNASISSAVFGRDGMSFYVAGSRVGENFIGLVRRSDGRVLERRDLPLDLAPGTLTPTKDGLILIVTASQSGRRAGTISLLSTDSLTERSQMAPCAGHPEGVAVLPDLDRAYVRCHGSDEILMEIDLTLGHVVRTAVLDRDVGLEPGRCGLGGVALSPSGSILLAPCGSSGTLLYLDRLTLTVLDSVPVGVGARDIAVASRPPIALITVPDSNRATLVDLAARSIITSMATPGRPGAVVISGDGRMGYMLLTGADGDSGSLVRLHLKTRQILNAVAVPPGTRALTVWPGRWSPTMRWR